LEHLAVSTQRSAKAQVHEPSTKKYRPNRLRDLSCLGTLLKDVRDVATAVLCSEGLGE
jgi:hypothetical protein